MSEGTGEGLVEFIDYAGSKGLMNPNTASAYKASTHRVMSIDDDWETHEVRSLDVEDQCERFARLKGSGYAPDSITTYQRRFTKAVEMYLEWLDNPGEFKSPFRDTPKASKAASNGSAKQKPAKAAPQPQFAPPEDTDDLVTYPFPLRSGRLVYLQLPRELPKADAQRLSAFIDSIAIDKQLALPSRSEVE